MDKTMKKEHTYLLAHVRLRTARKCRLVIPGYRQPAAGWLSTTKY